MKCLFIVLILILIGGVVGWWYWPDLKPGPLKSLTREIKRAAREVQESGQSQKVEFHPPDSEAWLLMGAAYCYAASLQTDFPENLIKEIDNICLGEHGHLFYIKNDRIVDYEPLGHPVYPVVSMAGRKGDVTLLIRQEKDPASSRDVRIEIAV